MSNLLTLAHIRNPFPSWEQLGDHAAGLVPAAIWAAAIIFLTYGGSRLASGRLRYGLQAGGLRPNVAILLARALWLILWLVGILLALNQFTNGLTPLAAIIGVLGLAASLALQSVLQNLVAGIYLLIERPFNVDDFIAVVGPAGANHEGRVEDIQMRTTWLRNRDGELILMPNFSIFSGVVTNRTVAGGLVQHMTLTMPRTTEVSDTRERVLSLVSDVPGVLRTPPPRLWVDKIEADTWTATLTLWATSQETTSSAVWIIGREFPDASVANGTPA